MNKQERRGVYVFVMILLCVMIYIFDKPVAKWTLVGMMAVFLIAYYLDKKAE